MSKSTNISATSEQLILYDSFILNGNFTDLRLYEN